MSVRWCWNNFDRSNIQTGCGGLGGEKTWPHILRTITKVCVCVWGGGGGGGGGGGDMHSPLISGGGTPRRYSTGIVSQARLYVKNRLGTRLVRTGIRFYSHCYLV